ncbi:acetyl-CoA carboxylase carboxyl transferase subunit alpha [Streptomyces sp. 2A115]|uniref:acetyl-CoA carboxylase carboxyl transferase subunit alpha n=1 Tax=Streptomyces sp. 2A115 TaxID=3457439 RepID=UPI003FD0F6FE
MTTAPVERVSRFGGADDDWLRCAGCGEMLYRERWERTLKVCYECGHHARLTVAERLGMLLDDGSACRFDADLAPVDLLGFADTKPYPVRLAEAQLRSGNHDAVVCVSATVGGLPLVVAALDFGFLGGSVGSVAGELIARAARRALADRIPLLIISASGGARMQEGAISLMQLAKTGQELRRLHEAGVLTVNLNTDPTYGGATASFATLGDVVIAEPGARIGFAGPEIIRQTIRQELPPRFQSAEFLAESGQVDMVLPRESLRANLARLLRMHAAPTAVADPEPSPLLTDVGQVGEIAAADLVKLARDIGRPTTADYCAAVFDDFVELRGDRTGNGDDKAIVGGIASVGGRTVVVIGHQKGHDIAELAARNFGMPQPWGYHRARRLMSYAARFGFPLVTFIDTPGAYPGVEAEQRGQGYAIARCIEYMSGLPVPVVSIVTGEGGSGGALALGVANRVLILENAYYSVISPEGCSTILFKDASSAGRAAEQLGITPRSLLRLGVVDGVVPEPPGGACADPDAMADTVRVVVTSVLAELAGCEPDDLVAQRYRRFAGIGSPEHQSDLKEGAR